MNSTKEMTMKTYAAPLLVLFLLSACGVDLSNLEQSQTVQVQDGLKGTSPKKNAKKGPGIELDAVPQKADESVDNGDDTPVDSVPGCTDPVAMNYNPYATVDDGSCLGNCSSFEGVAGIHTPHGQAHYAAYLASSGASHQVEWVGQPVMAMAESEQPFSGSLTFDTAGQASPVGAIQINLSSRLAAAPSFANGGPGYVSYVAPGGNVTGWEQLYTDVEGDLNAGHKKYITVVEVPTGNNSYNPAFVVYEALSATNSPVISPEAEYVTPWGNYFAPSYASFDVQPVAASASELGADHGIHRAIVCISNKNPADTLGEEFLLGGE